MLHYRNARKYRQTWGRLAAAGGCELLEDRRLLATFGTPWPEARSLSVSFPSDSATIGAYENSLRSVFDQVADRMEWQEAALKAFQTWAVHANINIGLVPDRGDALGTVGLGSNDPRFGEFRIGAFPQPGVLASALPYQQIAGTWSGDVLLNTQANWFLADPQASTIPVPAPNERGPAVELFTVLLHEAGNALGVADNNVRGTVMFTDYQGPLRTLTSGDITAIRRIYGARQDIFETVANNTRATSTRIVHPANYRGGSPLTINGSLNTMSDVDFYRFTPLAGRDKVNVRLWASGVSLLKAKLEVFDRNGVKISDVKADSIFDNNLEIEISSLRTHQEIFVRVSRNSGDVFGIGDYRLELDYRAKHLQPSIEPPVYDADADDDDQASVDYVSVDQLFSRGLVSTELGANDSLSTATALATSPGFLQGTRYEAQSSISSALDRDLFRIVAPATTSGILNVDVTPVGTELLNLDLVLLNANGDRVAAAFQQNARGSRSVQVRNPVPGATYFIGVKAEAGSIARQGNYIVTVDFATEAASLRTVFSGQVNGTQQDYSVLETAKPQFYRFDLSSTAATLDEGVQLSFFDTRTRDLVFTISVAAGSRTTEYIWLGRGEFMIQATARTRNGQAPGRIRFTLRADVISDDQGPNPVDPTQMPVPPDFDWNWVDSPPNSPPPVIDVPMPVYEDPWFDEYMLNYFADYYTTVWA